MVARSSGAASRLLFWTVSCGLLSLSSAQGIVSLFLIDANTNAPLTELADGDVVDLAALGMISGSQALNIEAQTTETVGSVQFGKDGVPDWRTENVLPFSLCGDKQGVFNACPGTSLDVGAHTVTATAFTGGQGSGTAGPTKQVSFTIVSGGGTAVTTAPITPTTGVPVGATGEPVTSPTGSPMSSPTVGAYSDSIQTFYLIRAPTKERIMKLYNGAVVSLQDLGLTEAEAEFNVEAVPMEGVASVYYLESDRGESALPFSYCGDVGGNFNTCEELAVGYDSTITVTPYTGAKQTGTAMSPVTISFSIQIESAAVNTVPSSSPNVAPTVTPTAAPSDVPSSSPNGAPTNMPTAAPSDVPSSSPNGAPTSTPTAVPSDVPSGVPSATPNTSPTIAPSDVPSDIPSLPPSEVFTSVTGAPSDMPSDMPSSSPNGAATPTPYVPGELFRFQVRDATSWALVEKLDDGDVLDVVGLGITDFDVLAPPATESGPINSVAFYLNGELFSTDNDLLYWMCSGPCALASGQYNLTAIPYSGLDRTGNPGLPSTVSFTVIGPAVPEPTAAPTAVDDVPGKLIRLQVRDAASMALIEQLDGDEVIDIDELGVEGINILAQTTTDSGPVGSVIFEVGGETFTANAPEPFLMCEEDGCDFETGEVTITAIPYSGQNGTGTEGEQRNVTFTFVAGNETLPTQPPIAFEDLLINCGGKQYVDLKGRTWLEDIYFLSGKTFHGGTQPIENTQDDFIYYSERNTNFEYEVPVPPGDYEIKIHFAEVFFSDPGKRVFDLYVEGEIFYNVDVVVLGGGKGKAFTLEVAKVVDDGFVNIKGINKVNNAKISGIEIILQEVHTAHAVAQGPYVVVDKDDDGFGVIPVDATPSHTHGPGLFLTDFIWKEGKKVVGTGEVIELNLPVGEHSISLTVIDSSENESTEYTTITVLPYGYPDILSITPDKGSISGGFQMTITGSGFTNSSDIVVNFGLNEMTDGNIQVIDENTIELVVPFETIAVPVQVSVTSIPLGATSNSMTFTYETAIPIDWNSKLIADFASVAVAEYGPDGKLYAATTEGQIAKITLDDDFNIVDAVASVVAPDRAILGLTFDPQTTADEVDPPIYFASSDIFHKEWKSSSAKAINGKIQRASGANMDIVEDIITGLPISDHDHGINAIVFGDNGELYMQIGSNTNGGLPGQLTGSQLQKENYYSAATVVAYLSDPSFNGNIEYSKEDDGVPTTEGVEVFASGLRNPFGICLHTNGNLYGTDNGPNLGYGDMKTGCEETDFIPDVETEDRIHVILEDHYYGHPNPIRAEADADPRQCKYRFIDEPSDAEYTAPIVVAPSSTGAVIEFQSDHFGGQLRHNLIYAKYTSKLYRVILQPDGLGVIPQSDPPLGLVGAKGLGVTQAPDGSLVQVQYSVNQLWVHIPVEEQPAKVKVNSVFPRRGPTAGGSKLTIYGYNLKTTEADPVVTVGASTCAISSATETKIICTLPGGSGLVDVTVTVGVESYTFKKGYKFTTGYR